MKGAASTAPRYAIPNYFTNPVIRPYLANVRNWQCYIRFLGLPDLRDNPDILIDRLFVTPLLARKYISPDENPKSWADEAETLLDVLSENSPLVLLGDPGIGKSTFLNYVAWLLSRPADNALIDRMGWRLPLPMVLRELPVRGVTEFDGLLEAFLGREMSAPLREDDGRYLRQALAEGQAFVLLDGIDELGDREARENLRSAVFDGMLRYPDCRWLLTSRIVGYDEVPFDSVPIWPDSAWSLLETGEEADEDTEDLDEVPDEYLDEILDEDLDNEGVSDSAYERYFEDSYLLTEEIWDEQVGIRYIAPFDDRRIAAFARNWYGRREASASRASANADHLVRAVHADESILRLARVPNLLTMMALIHRIEATLPHGRALLYERIAEAYLESIDKFRGIESSPHDLPRKKGWLARVGFEMQRRRMDEGRPDGANILVDGATVLDWLTEEMERSDTYPDTPSAEEFLKIVGRRSGLFLPRGEGRYAFVHLSFQEYFAAVALKREVTRLRWAKGNASRLGFDRDTLVDWAGQSLWREAFVFLFELLASEEDHDWHDDLLDCIFGKNLSRLVGSRSKEISLNLGHLLARLIVNSRSGLTLPKRMEAINFCVKVEFEHPTISWTEAPGIFSVLIGDDARLNAEILKQIGICLKMAKYEKPLLDFREVKVSHLGPLSSLASLKQLHLGGAHISDLDPLSRLTSLQWLILNRTGVSDLGPLSSLTSLQRLDLGRTGVSDLGPLSRLTSLQWLILNRTGVSDLDPLSGLTSLQGFDLGGTSVSDLEPLSELTSLRWLDLNRTGVSDLRPLSCLAKLEYLFLGGTDVSDLEPLSGLTSLRWLDLDVMNVSDLGPLSRLPALKTLHFREIQVPSDASDAIENLRTCRPEVTILRNQSNSTPQARQDASQRNQVAKDARSQM